MINTNNKWGDYMLNAQLVAKYFLSKDPDRILFNNNIVIKNNRKFYEGNARLNKYLFLSQVVYLARFEKKLISKDLNNKEVIL